MSDSLHTLRQQTWFFTWFLRLAPRQALATADQAQAMHVPTLGQGTLGERSSGPCFCSNLTATDADANGNGFQNLTHCDNDACHRLRELLAAMWSGAGSQKAPEAKERFDDGSPDTAPEIKPKELADARQALVLTFGVRAA